MTSLLTAVFLTFCILRSECGVK